MHMYLYTTLPIVYLHQEFLLWSCLNFKAKPVSQILQKKKKQKNK